jgi:hypothetical protein
VAITDEEMKLKLDELGRRGEIRPTPKNYPPPDTLAQKEWLDAQRYGSSPTPCGMPSLRERIEQQAQHAEQEAARAGRLRELSELLAKHPDVARIWDLLGDVRG